jgi:hypothetical protein
MNPNPVAQLTSSQHLWRAVGADWFALDCAKSPRCRLKVQRLPMLMALGHNSVAVTARVELRVESE